MQHSVETGRQCHLRLRIQAITTAQHLSIHTQHCIKQRSKNVPQHLKINLLLASLHVRFLTLPSVKIRVTSSHAISTTFARTSITSSLMDEHPSRLSWLHSQRKVNGYSTIWRILMVMLLDCSVHIKVALSSCKAIHTCWSWTVHTRQTSTGCPCWISMASLQLDPPSLQLLPSSIMSSNHHMTLLWHLCAGSMNSLASNHLAPFWLTKSKALINACKGVFPDVYIVHHDLFLAYEQEHPVKSLPPYLQRAPW